jgi:hypothetical protein
MEKTSGKKVTCTGRIGTTRCYGAYMVTLASLLHIGSILDHLYNRYVTLFRYHLYRLFGIEVGISKRFVLIGKNNIHVFLDQLFKKSMILMEGGGLLMFAILVIFARPLVSVFVGYDAELVDLSAHGMRIYSLIFITCGINIFVTGMFTALNNGVVSAFIATVRVVICEIGSVMILPIFFALNGVWFAAAVAEVGSIIPVIIFVVKLRKRYGYAD